MALKKVNPGGYPRSSVVKKDAKKAEPATAAAEPTKRRTKLKIPKTIGSCADLLYETKAKRLALQKQVDQLEAEEKDLKDHIINTLPKSQASGVAGKVARVSVTKKSVPQVKDWPKFFTHLKKTGEFELLQRRLNESAVSERWEAKKKIPGVEAFEVVTVSLNKI